MNTSGFSSHTPGTGVIKWAWLDIFHLTDVFDVVLVSHPLPPPTQLRWYLKRMHGQVPKCMVTELYCQMRMNALSALSALSNANALSVLSNGSASK